MGFCDVPKPEVIRAMTAAEGEFADIDVIAVTHRHGDHFYAIFVSAHLSRITQENFYPASKR